MKGEAAASKGSVGRRQMYFSGLGLGGWRIDTFQFPGFWRKDEAKSKLGPQLSTTWPSPVAPAYLVWLYIRVYLSAHTVGNPKDLDPI